MEVIIALVILAFTFKYVVLNVRVNSIIFLILGIVVYYFKPELIPQSNIALILILLNIIDCIRDVVIYSKYYEHMSDGIDGLYAFKSICVVALIVLGWFFFEKNFIWALIPRAVFLVAVYPIQYWAVLIDVTAKLDAGHPIPYHYQYYALTKKNRYWYQKVLRSLDRKNRIISNYDTVISETNTSRKKLKINYPDKMRKKISLAFMDKEKKDILENAMEKLKDWCVYKHMAYISTDVYIQYGKKIKKVLEGKEGFYSIDKIKAFPEFKNFDFYYSNGTGADTEWSNFFIIKVLTDYVEREEIQEDQFNDEDPLDNHAYGLKMKSQNAADNPLLALD